MGWALGGRAIYSEIQCIMGNGYMGTPPGEQNDELMERHD